MMEQYYFDTCGYALIKVKFHAQVLLLLLIIISKNGGESLHSPAEYSTTFFSYLLACVISV